MTRSVLLLFSLLVLPSLARGQSADSSGTDSVYVVAQRLMADGQGDSARALVQQRLDSAPAGSTAYVEALYWHAVVAATAGDAERDLRTIIVTYPAARRSADALLRLAQLEMARGETDQAMAHLQRLVVEHPDSPDRGRAEFWMARSYLNTNDLRSGCARLADASRMTPAGQVELQNQIAYLNQRCANVDTTAVVSAAASRSAPSAPSRSTASARRESAPPPNAASHGRYTVQVAAFSTSAAASRLRATLVAKGYDARVVGTRSPYRVRIGRYATRGAADAVAQRLRAQKTTAIVTTAESP